MSTNPVDTATTADPVARPLALPSPGAEIQESLAFIWRWILLGGAAGAWAGFLVGGIGGRIAMFVLRLTSSDSIRGVESDDGFTIGRISGATIFLLGITTAIGLVVGVVCVLARSQMPGGWGSAMIALAGGTLGAAAIIKPDGVDFNMLEPLALACVFFTVIPIAGAALAIWFIGRWQRWWWQNPRRTAIAALPWIIAVPTFFISIPVVLVALAIGTSAVRVGLPRHVLTGRIGRAAATAIAGVVIALASASLVGDLVVIL